MVWGIGMGEEWQWGPWDGRLEGGAWELPLIVNGRLFSGRRSLVRSKSCGGDAKKESGLNLPTFPRY